MEFKNFKELLINNFRRLGTNPLFEVEVDKDELWNIYLDSFPEGTNLIYRERRKYDCSCCRHFIKNIGGTVYIDENLVPHSIFDFDTHSTTFQPVADALRDYVMSKPIVDIYLNDSNKVGTDKNRELNPDGSVTTWEHFYLELPPQCVADRYSIATEKGRARDRRNVFKRSLDEISMDAIDTVLELIASNTLYRGEQWQNALTVLKAAKTKYDSLLTDQKGLYAWQQSMVVGDTLGRIRNHSIGILLVDISDGMDLDAAVRRYEMIIAPANYKRPKAIFTKRMLEEAKKTLTELGYMDSIQRRFATVDDITVNNILFSNRDASKRMGVDIFDEMLGEVAIDPKKFSRVEEVSVDKFVSDILPTAKELEVFLENKHIPNMVSLIAPAVEGTKSMFKWDNGFGWAYSGNITDSDIRERVKSAGGNVDGVLRFSIQWNDGKEYSGNDLDAHCSEPGYTRVAPPSYMNSGDPYIFFANMRTASGGFLDVDNRHPTRGVPAVENIAWPNKSRMRPGTYKFRVHGYENRGGKDGFRAEIEFDGKIYQYNYTNNVRTGEYVDVADVTLNSDGTFTIKEHLKSEASSRDVWGLKTNTFVPVTVAMYSPNYWDERQGIGHKHYFFMLKDCVNPEQPNGFYNEFLKHDLEQHKRVFEALGSKMAVVNADDQLSGLGFSSTKRGELIVKVKGATERMMKIKF